MAQLLENRKGHIYETPIGELPSVTTVLSLWDNGKSGALMGWAVKMMAEYLQSLADPRGHILITKDDTIEIFKKAKARHKTLKAESADLGSQVHNLIEVYLRGQKVDGLVAANPKLKKPFEAFVTWQLRYKFELVACEHIVWSAERYAGTLDCVAKLSQNGSLPKLFIVDFKTSNAIYEEYLLQVAAYARAYEEIAGVQVEGYGLLRLGKEDGVPEWHEYTEGEISQAYKEFLWLLRFWEERKRGNHAVKSY